MNYILIIIGLIFFEIITSIDNAIINADILTKMQPKARKWFLTWGILIAVFLVRGLLPFVLIYSFKTKILIIGGVFLVLLFMRWIIENSKYYLRLKKRFNSIINVDNDSGRIVYLELLDAFFSIDGVIGAFAFTLSIPLIIIGNGVGAIIVRQLTIYNIDLLKRFSLLKNGAMWAVLSLGIVMVLEGYGKEFPQWFSPVLTFIIIGIFLYKSIRSNNKTINFRTDN